MAASIRHEPSREWLAGRIGDAERVARALVGYDALCHAWRDARSARKETE
jgi:myo-inositol catabolism protein IolC